MPESSSEIVLLPIPYLLLKNVKDGTWREYKLNFKLIIKFCNKKFLRNFPLKIIILCIQIIFSSNSGP